MEKQIQDKKAHSRLRRIMQWPSRPYRPWWQILWACPWFIPLYLGRSLIFLAHLGGNLSLRTACDAWKGAR